MALGSADLHQGIAIGASGIIYRHDRYAIGGKPVNAANTRTKTKLNKERQIMIVVGKGLGSITRSWHRLLVHFSYRIAANRIKPLQVGYWQPYINTEGLKKTQGTGTIL